MISIYLIRIVGGISIFYALVGFAAAIFSITAFNHIDNVDFASSENEVYLGDTHGKDREIAIKALSRLPGIVDSFEFKAFYWSFLIISTSINLLLFYTGYQLLRNRLIYIKLFIALLILSLMYLYGAPLLLGLNPESMLALQFGGAWGIGNMGLSIHLYTYFLFWGLTIVSIGSYTYKNHNNSSNLTGAQNAPPS